MVARSELVEGGSVVARSARPRRGSNVAASRRGSAGSGCDGDITGWSAPLASDELPAYQTWTLDRRGNWTDFDQAIGSGIPATPIPPTVTTTEERGVSAVNEYTSTIVDSTPGTIAHDDAGNLTQDSYAPVPTGFSGGQKYVYDQENRLIKVTDGSGDVMVEYRYDVLGRRAQTRDLTQVNHGGVELPTQVILRHLYRGLQCIEERQYDDETAPTPTDETGTSFGGWVWFGSLGNDCYVARQIAWGAGLTEPAILIDTSTAGDSASTATEEFLYYRLDALGSVIGLTDEQGDLVERYTYDPYGQVHIETNSGGWTWRHSGGMAASKYDNPLAFTGHRFDAATGLHAAHFRHYSPRLGRWLSRDPAGYIDGVNLYEYVGGMPVGAVDPLGMCTWTEWFNGVCAQADHARAELEKQRQRALDRERQDIADRAKADIEASKDAGPVWQGALEGAGTGGKAVVNSLSDTADGLIPGDALPTLPVTETDRTCGYDALYSMNRVVHEGLAGAATGKLALSSCKYISTAGKGLNHLDNAQNGVMALAGAADAYENGLSWQNGAAMASGAAGVGGNPRGWRGPAAPKGGGRVNKVQPVEGAGPHTAFKRDPQTGKITGYTEYDGAGNPVKRYRGEGGPHGNVEPPLVLEPKPGKGPGSPPKRARPARPDEIPGGQ